MGNNFTYGQFGNNAGPATGAVLTVTGWEHRDTIFVYTPDTADQGTTAAGANTGIAKEAPGQASVTIGGVKYGNEYMWGTNNGGTTAFGTNPFAGNFIAADGAYETAAVTQMVTGLRTGTAYTLTFYWAAAQQESYSGATTEQWQVTFGGQTQSTSIINLPSKGFSGWRTQAMTFTAAAASQTLLFLAVGTPTGQPPFVLLGGVSLDAVPEPSAWALLVGVGAAVTTVGVVRRRRRLTVDAQGPDGHLALMIHGLTAQAWSLLLEAGRLAVWLALLVAIFVPLEWLCALHPAKIWRKQIGVDLCWYFINSLLPAAVLSFPLALLSSGLHRLDPAGFIRRWQRGRSGSKCFWFCSSVMWELTGGTARCIPTGCCGVFTRCTTGAEEMDWLVNTRAHPFDTVFVRFTGLAPVYLLGLAQTTGAADRPGSSDFNDLRHGLDVLYPCESARALGSAGICDQFAGVSSLASYEERVPRPQFCVRFPIHRPSLWNVLAAETLA